MIIINTIKNFLGFRSKVNYAMLVKQGAIILDVRTKEEYQYKHIKGSLNISVDVLRLNLHKLTDKSAPVIAICASGMRSAAAKSILKSQGYLNVYNGGRYTSLQNKMDQHGLA